LAKKGELMMKTTANRKASIGYRVAILLGLVSVMTIASTRLRADIATTGMCGNASVTIPFTDVAGNNGFFCAIAEAYFSGLTNGTSATTYSPSDPVPREQMAAFITRTLDQSLMRGSRRAALGQFWTPQSGNDLTLTTVGDIPRLVASDGEHLWVANGNSDTVSQVEASTGKVLGTWVGATSAYAALVARGRVYVTGADSSPGRIYVINPTAPPGSVTTLTGDLGSFPLGLAFDGSRIWTVNTGGVSIVNLNPVSVTAVSAGFSVTNGILYDGANIWVTDSGGSGTLKKLDEDGNVIQTVQVGNFPVTAVFDGANIWVPNFSASTVTVVRAATGRVLATLTGNGLNGPVAAAFDGERILVTNRAGNSVSLWKAADLTPLGLVTTGANSEPFGVCSDGLNFWVTLSGADKLARF
jgi:hypothetical protein